MLALCSMLYPTKNYAGIMGAGLTCASSECPLFLYECWYTSTVLSGLVPTARTSLCAVGFQSVLITVGGSIIVNGKWIRLATTELLDMHYQWMLVHL